MMKKQPSSQYADLFDQPLLPSMQHLVADLDARYPTVQSSTQVDRTVARAVTARLAAQQRSRRVWRHARLVVGVVTLMLAVGFVASPTGRVQAQEAIASLFQRVAYDTRPDERVIDPQAKPVPTAVLASNSSSLAASNVPMDDTTANASFAVKTPAYLPDGFQLIETHNEPLFVSFSYERDGVRLFIQQLPTDSPNFPAQFERIGATARIEQVQIATSIGEFVQGNWDSREGQVFWNAAYPWMRIRWIDQGVLYLVSTENRASNTLNKEELIAVAQSMQ